MRKAAEKLFAFYKTQLGQDVLETLAGASTAAVGQAVLTDMSPEEIALATSLGIGAAAIGRPTGGRIGQTIGTALDKRVPQIREGSETALEILQKLGEQFSTKEIMNAKLAPYANQSPSAQIGQFLGRGYGDNIAQAGIALAAPGLINFEEEV